MCHIQLGFIGRHPPATVISGSLRASQLQPVQRARARQSVLPVRARARYAPVKSERPPEQVRRAVGGAHERGVGPMATALRTGDIVRLTT